MIKVWTYGWIDKEWSILKEASVISGEILDLRREIGDLDNSVISMSVRGILTVNLSK